MPKPPENFSEFSSLLEIVTALRGPHGCPWDKEQTHKSLTKYAIEEACELAEAIDSEDENEIIGELGDVLFQVVLHSEIARQEGRFEIKDVIHTLCEKMVRRHPHVFADVKVKDSEEVLKNWGEIKANEKKMTRPSFGVPKGFPSLLASDKIGGKTKKYNFDWNHTSEVLEKVSEEMNELKEAIDRGDKSQQEKELGDVLFSIAQVARHLKIDPEQALRETNRRFEDRFFTMKKLVEEAGAEMNELSSEELEEFWQQAKVMRG